MLFVAGLLIGLGIGKLLKGFLLIVSGFVILIIVGFTVAGVIKLEELWTLFGPLKEYAVLFGNLLASYPAFSIGLIIGLVLGAIK